MASAKLIKIVELLISKTADGDVIWEPTAEEGVFTYSFPSHSVRLYTSDGPQGRDIVIDIINADGEVIEAVTDQDLQPSIPAAYTMMAAMYETARRQASGVESVLDEILDQLRGSGLRRRE